VATLEEPIDHPGVCRVVEHRRRSWVNVHPKVRSERDRRAPPDFESYGRVAPFKIADDGLADPNDTGDGGLRDVQSEPELAQFLRDATRIEPGQTHGVALDHPP
jgi:hypothetical protein